MQNGKKHKVRSEQNLEEQAFGIEITIGEEYSFYDTLLDAIDEAFTSLGESAKAAIYSYLENSNGIKKQEIPFRINDFQNALEKLFGVGARQMEIHFVKKLYEKIKTVYKWDMPRWVVPEITFQEYLRLARSTFEKSKERTCKMQLGGWSGT